MSSIPRGRPGHAAGTPHGAVANDPYRGRTNTPERGSGVFVLADQNPSASAHLGRNRVTPLRAAQSQRARGEESEACCAEQREDAEQRRRGHW